MATSTTAKYPIYVIQLEDPQLRAIRLCIAVVLHSKEVRVSRNSWVSIPYGNVYYADGCPAQGFRVAVLRDMAIPSVVGYRGKAHVGNVEPHRLAHFEEVLAATVIPNARDWVFRGLGRLHAQHEVPIYHPEPVWKGLNEGRRAWEKGED